MARLAIQRICEDALTLSIVAITDATARCALQEGFSPHIGDSQGEYMTFLKSGNIKEFLATANEPSRCVGMLNRPLIQHQVTPWLIR